MALARPVVVAKGAAKAGVEKADAQVESPEAPWVASTEAAMAVAKAAVVRVAVSAAAMVVVVRVAARAGDKVAAARVGERVVEQAAA